MKRESDEEMSEELNDKLNELWTDAAEKRRELMRSKLPDYSRTADSASGLA
jgi:predicted house-cleaning noncanonical NTP pyrophosphatase (MazG superfamily)